MLLGRKWGRKSRETKLDGEGDTSLPRILIRNVPYSRSKGDDGSYSWIPKEFEISLSGPGKERIETVE